MFGLLEVIIASIAGITSSLLSFNALKTRKNKIKIEVKSKDGETIILNGSNQIDINELISLLGLENRNPPKELEDDLQEEVKKLKDGYLNFECPLQMTLGNQENVKAEIFKDEVLLSTIENRQGLDEIKVGKTMSVKLSGKDFEITTLNDESQIILPNKKTKWQWDVVPLKHGDKILKLGVAVKLKIEGKEEVYNYDILAKNILVRINRVYIASKFLEKNWQWIISTVVGSGVLIVILKAFGYLPK